MFLHLVALHLLHLLRPAVWVGSKRWFFGNYSKMCPVRKLGNLEHVVCSVQWVMTTYLKCITQNLIVWRIFGCNVFVSTYYSFHATWKWNHDILFFPPCTYLLPMSHTSPNIPELRAHSMCGRNRPIEVNPVVQIVVQSWTRCSRNGLTLAELGTTFSSSSIAIDWWQTQKQFQ